MTTNTIIWVVIVFLMGVTVGVFGFIEFLRIYAFFKREKPIKKRVLSFMDRIYRKVESL